MEIALLTAGICVVVFGLVAARQGLSVTRWALGVERLGSPEPVAGVNAGGSPRR